MENSGWDALRGDVRTSARNLSADAVPASPGVYVWWRDGEPVYLDCARSLRVRLTTIDTRIAGEHRRVSAFRQRVQLLLQADGELVAGSDRADRTLAVDRWLARCAVSWRPTTTYREAEEIVDLWLETRRPLLHIWRPRPGEDAWLLRYFERLGGDGSAGRFYVEVPIGGSQLYGEGAKTRFIDAVRLPDTRPCEIVYFNERQFTSDLADQPVEIIEVKKTLNRTVIGQLVVAREMARADWPPHGPVRSVALCTEGDPALEWICQDYDIDVELVARDT